jgi:prepilin-type N-terminal cleavage/methylation domain-containing protein
MSTIADSRRQQGFTLLELVAVIIIVAIASVPLFGLFSQAGFAMLADETTQTATQLAQARAEYLVAVRRNRGYADTEVSANLVETLTGNYAGYTRTTTVTAPFAGPACPGGATCKQLAVRVDQGGQARAEVTFVLVNY